MLLIEQWLPHLEGSCLPQFCPCHSLWSYTWPVSWLMSPPWYMSLPWSLQSKFPLRFWLWMFSPHFPHSKPFKLCKPLLEPSIVFRLCPTDKFKRFINNLGQKTCSEEFLLCFNEIATVDWQFPCISGTQVWSPAWHVGFKIWCCYRCSVVHNWGSHLIPSPGTPYAAGQPKGRKESVLRYDSLLKWLTEII